jgi:predicted enzyme related to lactoylglutathione lyase
MSVRRSSAATIASIERLIERLDVRLIVRTSMVMVEPMQIAMKLEVVTLPVRDIERALEFYQRRLGWRLDADFKKDGMRAVQLTPPGSDCSIQFMAASPSSPPGSAQSIYLIVPDIEAAREDLVKRGIDVSPVFHFTKPPGPFGEKVPGPANDHQSYGSFATFRDPDGNGWLLQEVTKRLPGRIDATATSFGSPTDLATALRRASAAHGEHEKRTGKRDEDWPDWYAAYLAAEQSGKELPR